MSKKILKEEFLKRFYERYPNSNIEIIEYTAISKPLIVKCKKCGREIKKTIARQLLQGFDCCNGRNETRLEIVERLYKTKYYGSFSIVKKVDKDNIIVRHEKCGQEFKRGIQACVDNPDACPYCKTVKIKNMLSIEDAQRQLDGSFNGTIKILQYNGQLEKNRYKCLKCGFIFDQQHTSLFIHSRGCPKCDRNISRGEQFISNLLEAKGICFKTQVAVKELPLQHFDFAFYDDNGKLLGYIEVQGEQHFEKRTIFKDSLEKIQERDNRKRNYCKNNNIPLYELIYKKGKFLNLDILPF